MKKLLFIVFLGSLFKAEAQPSVLVIADSLYQSGNYSKAIGYYQKMGASVQTKLKIAKAYNHIGNYDKAIDVYEAVVKNNKNLQIALMSYYMMVRVIDERFDDSKLKLHYYKQFKKNFPDMGTRMKEYAEGGISDLKSEIHLATE